MDTVDNEPHMEALKLHVAGPLAVPSATAAVDVKVVMDSTFWDYNNVGGVGRGLAASRK